MSGEDAALLAFLKIIEHYAHASGIKTTDESIGSELAYRVLTCSIQEAASMDPPGGNFESKKKSDVGPSERGSVQDELDQEAIRKLPWCDYSETRLCKLVFETRAKKELLDVEKLRKALNEIRDDEALDDALFVRQEDQKQFMAAVLAREQGKKLPVKSYPPCYKIRPSLLQIEKKLHENYTKECVERNSVASVNLENTKKKDTPTNLNTKEKENDKERDKQIMENVKTDQKKKNNKNGKKRTRK